MENMENKNDLEKNNMSGFKIRDLNFYKYSDDFKDKNKKIKNILDIIINLEDLEKAILIFENMLENSFLFYSLFPNPKINTLSRKLYDEAIEYYENFLSSYIENIKLKEDNEKTSEEIRKINELEKFMKEIEEKMKG